jgi:two-component system OmpR family sensor kinase
VTLSIRGRLALVCALLVGAMVIGLGAIVYLRLEADLRAAADDGLVTRAEELLNQPVAGDTMDIGPSDVGDIFAQVVAADGRVVATTPGLQGDVLAPSDVATVDGDSIREIVVQAGGEPLLSRVLAARQVDGTVLILGVAFDDQREALDRLLGLLVVVAPLAAALAAVVGWVVAAAALRPVARMRRESEAISGSEPSRRLDVPATRDELAELGASLNRMLDRLEAALQRERRFVDDASHELRTPLANLKVELELALRRSRTPDELEAALRSAAVETDRLTSLAEDLLVLARAADGRLPIRRDDIDLGALVDDVVKRFAGRAEERGITLATSSSVGGRARVDGVRVRQALGNLIENAMIHTPIGGRITVGIARSDGLITIAVADTGEGFPPGFMEHAFEPFSRADAARSPDRGGTGLGLAIVRVVAEGHGGTVQARNNPGGGATVELTLPWTSDLV